MATAFRASYSRGLDGRTPVGLPEYQQRIESLHYETANSLGKGEYALAQQSFDKIDVVRQEEGKERLAIEKERQVGEKTSLDKSYKVELKKFEEEWAAKLVEVEKHCAASARVLEEEHEVGRATFERELEEKLKKFRFKASVQLLQLEDTERRLGLANEFKQAAEVGSRAQKQRRMEEADYNARRCEMAARPRQELTAKHKAETDIHAQKCHGMRVDVKRGREQALAVLRQRYRNLEADLTHAHALEAHMPAEIGAVISHQSRSFQSSTFRGTLKFESLVGTKFDVPDVTRLPAMVAE